MFRKVITASILGFLLAGTLISVAPAGAATVSNGTLCTKSGAKTKVGANVYTCTKSPTINKTKLTWVWSGCLEAQAAYTKSQTTYTSLAASVAKNTADTSAAADALGLVMIGMINNMIEYKGTKDYQRGDTVYVRDLGYFSANIATIAIDKTNASKPSAANTGALGSTSLWTIFVPVGPSTLNKNLDAVPTPEAAIAERKADIARWGDLIKKLSADSKLTKDAKVLNQITGLINSFSAGITSANTSVINLESNVSRLKRLNSSEQTLKLTAAQLSGAKLDISTNLMMRNQACAKGL
jgi:hypothetical protein